mmetsp:Transcript_29806/g.69195  ORF Transcript_29806/g.69195 Transcript_29806/m.69195 type:complete len:261 (+) Transcript_29806:421-1203(+)
MVSTSGVAASAPSPSASPSPVAAASSSPSFGAAGAGSSIFTHASASVRRRASCAAAKLASSVAPSPSASSAARGDLRGDLRGEAANASASLSSPLDGSVGFARPSNTWRRAGSPSASASVSARSASCRLVQRVGVGEAELVGDGDLGGVTWPKSVPVRYPTTLAASAASAFSPSAPSARGEEPRGEVPSAGLGIRDWLRSTALYLNVRIARSFSASRRRSSTRCGMGGSFISSLRSLTTSSVACVTTFLAPCSFPRSSYA